MSTRLHDQNPDIGLMRGLIDDIYRELGWPVRADSAQATAPAVMPERAD
jgi:hypothetical protein